MLFRLILLALAGIYYIAYKVHHRFCLRQGSPLGHARLIVVGSFLAGGAGKTPFVAWLAQFISAGNDGNSSAAARTATRPESPSCATTARKTKPQCSGRNSRACRRYT